MTVFHFKLKSLQVTYLLITTSLSHVSKNVYFRIVTENTSKGEFCKEVVKINPNKIF